MGLPATMINPRLRSAALDQVVLETDRAAPQAKIRSNRGSVRSGAQQRKQWSQLLNLYALQELLVFMADEFDHLRAVCHNPLIDSHGKGSRVRFRIVDGELDVQLPEVHAPEPLRQPQRLGIRAASGIQPSVVRVAGQRAAEII